MSASGKTPYFNLGIYRTGDILQYIPDYNDNFTKIDEQMHNNQVSANQNAGEIGTINDAVTNMQNQINELRQTLTPLTEFTSLPVTRNTQNTSAISVNSTIVHDNKLLYINVSIVSNANNQRPADYPVTVKVNNRVSVPLFSIPGNIFNLANGASNVRLFPNGFCFIVTGEGRLNILATAVWNDNNVTQFGYNLPDDYQYSVYNLYICATIPLSIFAS